MGAMGLDSTLNIAHVNCANTGDMEIAHVNLLPFFPVQVTLF